MGRLNSSGSRRSSWNWDFSVAELFSSSTEEVKVFEQLETVLQLLLRCFLLQQGADSMFLLEGKSRSPPSPRIVKLGRDLQDP